MAHRIHVLVHEAVHARALVAGAALVAAAGPDARRPGSAAGGRRLAAWP